MTISPIPRQPYTAEDVDFSVPTLWNDTQVAKWISLPVAGRRLTSVFGSLQLQPGGHARSPSEVPYVDKVTLVDHVEKVKRLGLKFLYLLNGLSPQRNIDGSTLLPLLQNVDWVLNRVCPDGIVIADIRVAHLIRSEFTSSNIPFRVSTVAGIKTREDLEPWLGLGIDGVVMHHDAGRDFESLERLVAWLSKYYPSVEVEIIVNESCLANCRDRQAHYARLAATTEIYVDDFQQKCNIPRFLDPARLLEARWVRPEDIGIYRSMGIRRFKIGGRGMPSNWLDRTVAAYLSGFHDGNLVQLLTMTPPGIGVPASDVVFIENRCLWDSWMNSDALLEPNGRYTAVGPGTSGLPGSSESTTLEHSTTSLTMVRGASNRACI